MIGNSLQLTASPPMSGAISGFDLATDVAEGISASFLMVYGVQDSKTTDTFTQYFGNS